MNNNNSNSDYNENFLLLITDTVEYIGGVLFVGGVPVMPAAFSVETDYAYELYLEFVGEYDEQSTDFTEQEWYDLQGETGRYD